jgi:prepilin-type N-terminal cleavage/methylation domain-containing protein
MRAFTIVELLAVIMIMAILMAVGMKALKVDPTQAACSQIAAQLRMARDHAIAKRAYVEVAVYRDTSKNLVMTTYQCTDIGGVSTPAAQISYLPISATINSSSSGSIKVTFKQNGSLYNNDYKTGSAEIATRAQINQISVSAIVSNVLQPIAIGAQGVEGAKNLYLNVFTGKASFWE